MPATNVPPIIWGLNGPQVPSGPAILSGVQADITASFGTALNFNLNTPQGQLSSSWAADISNAYQLVSYYAFQTDPAYAQGRMQDGIAAIYQITRIAAIPTTIQVSCLGSAAPLPAGPTNFATVVDQTGNIYQATSAGTLPVGGGTITLSFACLTPGPIPIPSALTISPAIPGWDTATVVGGSVGQNTETSQQLELRRSNSVSGNAQNLNDAILGLILGVPGVLDAYVVDNPTSGPVTIGGVVIPANTIFIAVTGGAAAAVAQAIWSKKPPGIPLYAGNNSQTVVDPNPRYVSNPPQYTITWQTPATIQAYFAVVIANSSLVPTNATTLIQQAIITAFQGGVAIFTGSISGTTLNVSAVEQGALAVGLLLNGPRVSQSTVITALGTGQGGIGTYIVSQSQIVASTAISASPQTNTPVPPPARIGSTIYANQYGALIGALGSWAAVKSLLVGLSSLPTAYFVGYISGNTLTVLVASSGTIAVNQFLNGLDSAASIPVGTIIAALGSGSGGTGTYTLNNSLTLAGATFTGTRNTADQITASAVTGIINIGDVIVGTGISAGVTITGQISGTTGGAGVYSTSADTSASSASVTCGAAITAAAANQNYVALGINQEPNITAASILVSFA
jgi:hypothetical protein